MSASRRGTGNTRASGLTARRRSTAPRGLLDCLSRRFDRSIGGVRIGLGVVGDRLLGFWRAQDIIYGVNAYF